MVTFDPPSIGGSYEVELGRQFSLSCMFNRNIYPTPILFEGSRASAGMCNSISYPVCGEANKKFSADENITFSYHQHRHE